MFTEAICLACPVLVSECRASPAMALPGLIPLFFYIFSSFVGYLVSGLFLLVIVLPNKGGLIIGSSGGDLLVHKYPLLP